MSTEVERLRAENDKLRAVVESIKLLHIELYGHQHKAACVCPYCVVIRAIGALEGP